MASNGVVLMMPVPLRELYPTVYPTVQPISYPHLQLLQVLVPVHEEIQEVPVDERVHDGVADRDLCRSGLGRERARQRRALRRLPHLRHDAGIGISLINPGFQYFYVDTKNSGRASGC